MLLKLIVCSGVPTIRFAQKHGAANLLNLSTVATFFSAVTATTLQFSFDDTGSTAANAVNAFWFTSLVFSIGELDWLSCVKNKLLNYVFSCCSQQSAWVNMEAGHVVSTSAVFLISSAEGFCSRSPRHLVPW